MMTFSLTLIFSMDLNKFSRRYVKGRAFGCQISLTNLLIFIQLSEHGQVQVHPLLLMSTIFILTLTFLAGPSAFPVLSSKPSLKVA